MLKNSHTKSYYKTLLLSAVIFCALILVWSNRAVLNTTPEIDQNFLQKSREGLASGLRFAKNGSGIAEVASALEVSTSFIQQRSGLQLDTEARSLLTEIEHKTLSGEKSRLTVSNLTDIFTDFALERLSEISDTEASQAVETMRGIDSPDLPETFRKGREYTHLRASHSGPPYQELLEQFNSIRQATKTPDGKLFVRKQLRPMIEESIKSRLYLFSKAVPEQWGGTWNTESNTEGSSGVSPQQAFVLAYSIAADDTLASSVNNLKQEMKNTSSALAEKFGSFPDPDNYFAYGKQGFVYPSPLDICFTDLSTKRLIVRLEAN